MPPTAQQLQRIFYDNLGLRVGQNTQGAAYSMADFGDGELFEIFKWTINPTSDPQRLQVWEDHLYNTLWEIYDLPGQKYKILIVSNAPPTAENYLASGGIGDKRTFRKCNHLSPTSDIVAEQIFDEGQIQQAINWILTSI